MKHSIFFILLTLITMSVCGQNITITGTVTDKKGNPIVGATITEKGVTNSTLSDAEGHYQISVKDNPVLIFEMKGYLKREFMVDDVNAPISVVLSPYPGEFVFGLIAGGNLNVKSDFDIGSKWWYSSELVDKDHVQPFLGYHAGCYVSIDLRKVFGVDAMALFDSRGIKEKDGNFTSITRFHSVSLPLFYKFKINIHNNNLLIFLGGGYNFFINGRAEKTLGSTKRSWDIDITHHRFYASFIGGVGFETKFGLGARLSLNYWEGYYPSSTSSSVYMMQASLTYRLYRKLIGKEPTRGLLGKKSKKK